MNWLRLFSLAAIVTVPILAPAAEIAVLNEATWNKYAPQGKEVDAIYGDYVLRNEKLVAVIANPVDGRNANMKIKNVGGCLIDFTPREKQNDQLGAFYPLGTALNWRSIETGPPLKDDAKPQQGSVVSVRVTTKLHDGDLTAETTYVLADDADHLAVGTKLTNHTDKPIKQTVKDELTVQGGFIKGKTGKLAWQYDRWWDAAYGAIDELPENGEVEIPAKESKTVMRKLFAAAALNRLQEVADVQPSTVADHILIVTNSARRPIALAYVEVHRDATLLTAGETDFSGRFVVLDPQANEATVSHPAYGIKKVPLTKPPTNVEIKLPDGTVGASLVDVNFKSSGTFAVVVTDDQNIAIPCKIQFRGVGETKDPEFFDKTGEFAVGNLYYTADGMCGASISPGKYDVTISYGTEYDIDEQQVEIRSGSITPIIAKLKHSIDTRGWVSADFHSHSSPSGDNSSSQLGRVLNLLCENIEFAPCTEHNRVSSYEPLLQQLLAGKRMMTCSGIEFTGQPLPLNHRNAFPMKMHEHTQDGGGPTIDQDTEVAVERLALWDDRSRKLIQQNHPDIGHLFFDKNGDGKPDEGHARVFGHLDCIEVHPPHHIFSKPIIKGKGDGWSNNTIFNWLQLLNQGYRIPGVVNTDAHYNIHGSGWLRTYIRSITDDPAKIDITEMVHAAEHGQMVMTNGPFLEAELVAGRSRGGPGDDVVAKDGKAVLHVKVQCANWYDIDRVQVFINGRPDPKLNFTRKENPEAFGDKVVKFERDLPLELAGDAHVIVATIGEKTPKLGRVMGPEHDDKPCAVSNPIYVDVDGGGFRPNKDTLDAPLPMKAPYK